MRILCILLLLVTTVRASDIQVYNNVEKHDGWPYLHGPKIVIDLDSGIYITTANDVGYNADMNFMDGINGSFSQASGYDNNEVARYWSVWSYEDTVYSILIDESGGEHTIYKFFGTTEVCYDTMGTRTSSFGFGAINTNGTDWVGTHKIGTLFQGIYTLTSARLCGGTAWVLTDSISYGSGVQWNMRAAPILGGLVIWNVQEAEIHIVEDDGTLNEDALTGMFGNMLSARTVNGGSAGWDVCIVPVELDGSGDSVMFAITDSVTLDVEVFLAIVDSSDGSITLVDSAVVTGSDGATNHFDDSTGWRTPSLTMSGDGVILTCRGWADTVEFDTTRIEYYIATDRSDLSTFGSVQTVAIAADRAMGELMAPWRGVTHSDNPNDSTILCFAWQAWDGASTVYLTPDTIAIPSAGAPPEVTVVPNFIHSIDGAGLRQSAEGVSVIHGPL